MASDEQDTSAGSAQASAGWNWLARGSFVLACASVLYLGRVALPEFRGDLPAATETTGTRESTGTEIVMLVIGSSTCGASMNDSLPRIVASIATAAGNRAEAAGKQFATVGVAIDGSASAGLKFLSRIDQLDEIVAGRNWLNSAAVTYLWRDLPGNAALPQVVLIERPIEVDTKNIRVGKDSLLARVIGLDSLSLWARGGARW